MTNPLYPPTTNPEPGTTFLAPAEMGIGWMVIRFFDGAGVYDTGTTVAVCKSKRAANAAAKKISATTGEPIR